MVVMVMMVMVMIRGRFFTVVLTVGVIGMPGVMGVNIAVLCFRLGAMAKENDVKYSVLCNNKVRIILYPASALLLINKYCFVSNTGL